MRKKKQESLRLPQPGDRLEIAINCKIEGVICTRDKHEDTFYVVSFCGCPNSIVETPAYMLLDIKGQKRCNTKENAEMFAAWLDRRSDAEKD